MKAEEGYFEVPEHNFDSKSPNKVEICLHILELVAAGTAVEVGLEHCKTKIQ